MPVGFPAITAEQMAVLNSLPKLHFGVFSTSTIIIGTDNENPSYFNNISLASTAEGFELITAADDRMWVKNVSGRTISAMVGGVSFQPNKSGGGTTELRLFSERTADDGVTKTINPNSLRDIEVSNNGETFKTALSAVTDLADGEAIAFAAFVSSGGALSFESPSETVNDPNETVTGLSFYWQLTEV